MLGLEIVLLSFEAQIMALQLQPSFVKTIKEVENNDLKLQKFKRQVETGERTNLSIYRMDPYNLAIDFVCPRKSLMGSTFRGIKFIIFHSFPTKLRCIKTCNNTFGGIGMGDC